MAKKFTHLLLVALKEGGITSLQRNTTAVNCGKIAAVDFRNFSAIFVPLDDVVFSQLVSIRFCLKFVSDTSNWPIVKEHKM